MGEKIKKVRVKRIIDSPLEDKTTMDDNDINILNNLISLSKGGKKEKEKEKTSRKKEKKKDKKKNKKKDKIKKPKLNLDALRIFDEDDEVKKDNEEFYEQRFSSSLILLRDVLKEVNDNIVENKLYLNELKNGRIGDNRIKMSPMTISSQMTNIASLVNTKLSAIKQITDVNKSISDLELKKVNVDQKINGTEDKEQNSKLMMDKVFDQLINFDMPDDPYIEQKTEKKKKNKKYKNIDDRINQLEEKGELEFTDNEKAFKYEKDGVEVAIRKDFDKGTWEFFAQNKKGDELFDYPLPDKKNVGRMKFDDKSDKAKDALGQTYNVYLI